VFQRYLPYSLCWENSPIGVKHGHQAVQPSTTGNVIKQPTSYTATIDTPTMTMTMSSAARMLVFDDFTEALAATYSSYLASATSDFRASISCQDISEITREILVTLVARLEALEAARCNDCIDSFKTKLLNPSLPFSTFHEHRNDKFISGRNIRSVIHRIISNSPNCVQLSLKKAVITAELSHFRTPRILMVLLPRATCLLKSAQYPPPSISIAMLQLFATAIASHYKLATEYHETNKSGEAQEVRANILAHYFTSVDTISRIFVDIDVRILPSAMEWIGRDDLGFSAMYHLLRGHPQLYSSSLDILVCPLVSSSATSSGVCSATKDVCPTQAASGSGFVKYVDNKMFSMIILVLAILVGVGMLVFSCGGPTMTDYSFMCA